MTIVIDSSAIVALALSDEDAAVMSLARTHNLTSYDASYLELAIRNGSTLATLDKRLKAAAVSQSVPVLPEP